MSWGHSGGGAAALTTGVAPVLSYLEEEFRAARTGPVASKLILPTGAASGSLLTALDVPHSACEAAWTPYKLS